MNAELKSDATRQKILNIAAEEIHQHGFQACKISQIIKKADISKGALYHHFPSKLDMGYAVFDEVLTPEITTMWQPIMDGEDPIQDMSDFFREVLSEVCFEEISKGCPVNNLAQEMSAVDEGYRLRINHIMMLWQEGIAGAIRRGQENGLVDREVNADRTASFIIASIEGAHGLAKNYQNVDSFAECLNGLIDYLQRLRPAS